MTARAVGGREEMWVWKAGAEVISVTVDIVNVWWGRGVVLSCDSRIIGHSVRGMEKVDSVDFAVLIADVSQ